MSARWVCCLDSLSVTGIAGRFARSVKAIRLQKRCIFRKLGLRTDTGRFRIRHALEGQASAVPPAAFGEALRGGGRRPSGACPIPSRRRRRPGTHPVCAGVGAMRCAARAAGGFPAA
uniref:Hypothethical protein, bacterial regulatory protein domain, LuxR family (Modular protein) n=1 Tax=Ralstonia solanacearum TaxID=305 RepID=A0A0S4UHB9_RALSL|nr:Hypothethical protein, bacterial regulatory protein domain, LuxR family (modular protein) [Ralstonia solanacearum]CUV33963.1 Hypothethical protein, bacterial regulatory protein domain, LuxR family (modular protein) [Ralstonia solanacearum]CUV37894.1 Hypothethical protein, bacterial regulatory protein domain, LuxR family (modular protein) [Ralstonia solanacearum]CUV59997.1 Hypothethical protein, bacterial regulatory protein domain, LuxR family (modular protein) [Ralstonia solanacearum]